MQESQLVIGYKSCMYITVMSALERIDNVGPYRKKMKKKFEGLLNSFCGVSIFHQFW